MIELNFLIRPRDPVLIRDARPFGTDPGAQARSLDWPLPSTVAGALRTHIGNANDFKWNEDISAPDKAKAIQVKGPLMVVADDDVQWKYYFHAPADAVVYKDAAGNVRVSRLSPMNVTNEAGANFPGLKDQILPLAITEEFKPEKGYDYWSLDDTTEWLSNKTSRSPKLFRGKLVRDYRVHVAIDSNTFAHKKSKLFSTESLCLPDVRVKNDASHNPLAMMCQVKADVAKTGQSSAFLQLGGERRAVMFETGVVEWPVCPETLKSLSGRRLKLQLVTPGLFGAGWLSNWMKDGRIPGIDGVTVKLKSAAIPRRIPVSGWDMVKNVPKPVRYACPAGSVYFLELDTDLTPALIQKLWMCSICDIKQDNLDGFGIAIPGVWDYYKEESK